jgi:hypothetical protein
LAAVFYEKTPENYWKIPALGGHEGVSGPCGYSTAVRLARGDDVLNSLRTDLDQRAANLNAVERSSGVIEDARRSSGVNGVTPTFYSALVMANGEEPSPKAAPRTQRGVSSEAEAKTSFNTPSVAITLESGDHTKRRRVGHVRGRRSR